MTKRTHQRGVLFIIAIVSLAVMLTLGGSLVAMTTQQVTNAKHQLRNLHSIAAADAGLNYVVWDKRFSATEAPGMQQHATINGTALPAQTDPRSLTKATEGYTPLSVQLLPNNAVDDVAYVWVFPYTKDGITGYQLISRGEYKGYSRVVRAVLQGDTSTGGTGGDGGDDGDIVYPDPPPITAFALYSGTNLTIGGQTKVNGLVGSNGNFTTSGQASVSGGINAAGSITLAKSSTVVGPVSYGTTYTDKGSSGAKTPAKTGQAVPFPNLDMAAWKSFAQAHGLIINGDLNISSTAVYDVPVIYVTGDVKFSGQSTIKGKVTIISEGTIHLSGQIATDPAPPSDKSNLTLVAAKGAKFTGQTNVNAVIYTHSATSDADALGSGQATIYGALIADTLSGSGQFTINYRKPDASVLPPVDDGGDSGGGGSGGDNKIWQVASWEPL